MFLNVGQPHFIQTLISFIQLFGSTSNAGDQVTAYLELLRCKPSGSPSTIASPLRWTRFIIHSHAGGRLFSLGRFPGWSRFAWTLYRRQGRTCNRTLSGRTLSSDLQNWKNTKTQKKNPLKLKTRGTFSTKILGTFSFLLESKSELC